MTATALDIPAHPESFRLATPVVRSATADLTAIALLSMAALTVWMLVLPIEVVFLAI
jgi:hypothetical protein